MRQNQRDAVTHIALSVTLYGLAKSGTVKGWELWGFLLFGVCLLIFGAIELLRPKWLE